MTESPGNSRPVPPKSPTPDAGRDRDETMLASKEETALDIDKFLLQARSFEADPLEQEERCTNLVSRLKDINTIRRLAAAASHSNADPALPKQLGQLELLESLGGGGMGQVFKARHVRLGKIQAVKILHAHRLQDTEAIARFQKEIRAIGELQHPNIVAAQHADEADGVPYLVMDYVDGQSLSELARKFRGQNKNASVGLACELVRQAAIGLQYAHERGVIHRDVKPGNIMLDRFGIVRVLDLGLARVTQQNETAEPTEDLTTEHQILGTPDYMAPEQLRDSKSVDARCDVYALGATLYYLLTGQVVYPSTERTSLMDKAVRIMNDTVPQICERRNDIPDELAAVVSHCLVKTPEDRLSSAGALADALTKWASPEAARTALADEPSTTTTSPDKAASTVALAKPSDRGERPPARRWLLLGAGMLLPMIVLAGMIYRLKLPEGGELVIELKDPAANLTIVAVQDDKSRTFELETEGPASFKLTHGPWQLKLSGTQADGFELSEDSIVMLKGGRPAVTINRRRADVVEVPTGDSSMVARVPETIETTGRESVPAADPASPAAEQPASDAATTADAFKWMPSETAGELAGMVLQPATIDPRFDWQMQLRRRPTGSWQWQAGDPHLDVNHNGTRWTYSTAKTIQISDVASGRIEAIATGAGNLNWFGVAFSPVDDRFASIDHSGERGIEIRDGQARLLSTWFYRPDLQDYSPVDGCQIAWMPNGQQILVWCGQAALVYSVDGTLVHKIGFGEWRSQNHYSPLPWTVAIHPNGQQVTVLGGGENVILQWDSTTNQLTKLADIHSHGNYGSNGLEYSPTGDQLLVMCADENTGQEMARIYDSAGLVIAETERDWQQAAWAPDGRAIVTNTGLILDGQLQAIKKLPLSDGDPYPHAMRTPFWKQDAEIIFAYADENSLDRSGVIRRFRTSGTEVPSEVLPQPLGVVASSFLPAGDVSTVYSEDYFTSRVFQWTADGVGRVVPNGGDVIPNQISQAAWSHTDGRLWMRANNRQYLMDLSSGDVRRINTESTDLDRHSAAYSPNGEFLAYTLQSESALIVEGSDGKTHQFHGSSYNNNPLWSTDSRWLVWTNRTESGVELVVVDAMAIELEPLRIQLGAVDAVNPRYAICPDSRLLAFLRAAATPNQVTLVVRELSTGRETEQVVDWMGSHLVWPQWSDDGKRLFAGTVCDVSQQGELTPVDGATSVGSDFFTGFVSLNRTTIGAYDYSRQNAIALSFMNADGTSRRSLPLTSEIRTSNFTPSGSTTTHKHLLLTHLVPRNDSVSDGIAVVDTDKEDFLWNGFAFDNGRTLTLGPGGNILDGPKDIDRYVVHTVRHAGGRTVPLTRQKFLDRLNATDSRKAMLWAMDHGARVRISQNDKAQEYHTLSTDADALPDAVSVVGFDLSDCRELSVRELSHLQAFDNLEELTLSRSSLATLPDLAGLTELKQVTLEGLTLSTVDTLTIPNGLQSLNLAGTNVDGPIGAILTQSEQLQSLDLSHTNIDRFTLLDLAKLKHLADLNLRGVSIDPADIATLQMMLPDCVIVHE